MISFLKGLQESKHVKIGDCRILWGYIMDKWVFHSMVDGEEQLRKYSTRTV